METTLVWILAIGALALQVYSLIDAARARKDAFPASENQTKTLWLVLLTVAAVIGFLSLPHRTLGTPLNMFNLIAVVIAGIYLARVRPGVRGITGSGDW